MTFTHSLFYYQKVCPCKTTNPEATWTEPVGAELMSLKLIF